MAVSVTVQANSEKSKRKLHGIIVAFHAPSRLDLHECLTFFIARENIGELYMGRRICLVTKFNMHMNAFPFDMESFCICIPDYIIKMMQEF